MKNVLRVDFEGKRIIMDRTFAKNCSNPTSDEYALLQRTRCDYPTFMVSTRTCAKKEGKEAYKGLTYGYMEHYIITHEKGDNVLKVLDEYNELRLISECHSKSRRYPAIKRWFLAKYPEITEFGLLKVQLEDTSKPAMKLISNSQQPVEAAS